MFYILHPESKQKVLKIKIVHFDHTAFLPTPTYSQHLPFMNSVELMFMFHYFYVSPAVSPWLLKFGYANPSLITGLVDPKTEAGYASHLLSSSLSLGVQPPQVLFVAPAGVYPVELLSPSMTLCSERERVR